FPSAVLDEGELLLQRATGVLEEDAAHTPGLVAVGDPEVAIAVDLVASVAAGLVALAHVAENPVEVHRVFLVEVVRRQICAAAEPGLGSLLDEAPVGVHRRNARIARMEDEAQPRGEEAPALALQPLRELFLELAPDRGDVHPRLLEHPAAL